MGTGLGREDGGERDGRRMGRRGWGRGWRWEGDGAGEERWRGSETGGAWVGTGVKKNHKRHCSLLRVSA